jgi:putative hydrolase of the HAD superfamily
VFDLDDTLYIEEDYVRSGFREVAGWLHQNSGVSGPDTFQELMGLFREGVQGRIFDIWLDRHPQLITWVKVNQLVEVYRTHHPDIALLPGMLQVFSWLRNIEVGLSLITDGPLLSQERKATALELTSWFSPLIFTDAWGKAFWKPHTRAFEDVMRLYGGPPQGLVYVGDNIQKDFVAPRRLGWRTVRLRIPGQLHYNREPEGVAFAAEAEVASLEQLTVLLRQWL